MPQIPWSLFGYRKKQPEVGCFDAHYYRDRYPDVVAGGADPFQHFMQHGWKEGRNPSAEFVTLYYRDKHLGGAAINPLTHYVTEGRLAGKDAHPPGEDAYLDVQMQVVLPLFDTSGRFAEIDAPNAEALRRYLRGGWQDSLPFRLEDTAGAYLDQVSYVMKLNISPLYHYASQKRLSRFRAKSLPVPDKRPPQNKQTDGKQRSLLKAALRENFDRDYYLSRYTDVLRAGMDPLDHFLDSGWREGRWPNMLFDPAFYLREYPEVRVLDINPLYHYLMVGREAGLRPNPIGLHPYPAMSAPPDDKWWVLPGRNEIASARCVVVMPVYRGYDETLAAIHAVLAARQTTPFALHVIDDHSPDTALSRMLAELNARGLFSLEVNAANFGFVSSVNAALCRFPDRTIILLNSDSKVAGDWIDRLVAHTDRDPTIATVTPFSNNATICSYPLINENNTIESEVDAASLDGFAAQANAGRTSEIPTGIGFCFLMTAASRAAVGLFDEDAFGRGYGEENDFCLRAAKAGFRNVLAEDVFVYHVGEVSFGKPEEAEPPGQKALVVKHPDYPELIRQHLRVDRTEVARIRLDLRRLAAAVRPRPVVLVTHALAGGIVTHVEHEMSRLAGEDTDAILLRVGVRGRWNVEVSAKARSTPFTPNLRELPFGQYREHLADFLRWLEPDSIHVHSFVGFDWQATTGLMALVQNSGIPYRFTLHDYSVVCHRNDLVLSDNRYCGLAEIEHCRSCVATDRNYPEAIDPALLRETYARFLEGAERVVAPSRDIADRLHRAGAGYAIYVQPHADEVILPPALAAADTGDVVTVVIIGAIGAHKGSRVILNLARDAKARKLPIRYCIVGYSDITNDLADAGVVESGRFLKLDEAMATIAEVAPHLIFLPAIWPETWSYTLSMAFTIGVPPVVFDIGAPADRIRDRGFGTVLPYSAMDDVHSLNDRMVELGRERLHRVGRSDGNGRSLTDTLSSSAIVPQARAGGGS